MNNFKNLKTTQYGDMGEMYISEFSNSFGCKPYQPSIEQSNPVDSLNVCYNNNKLSIVAIEVKTKGRMLYYNMTGMDKNDWELYKNFPVNVCILFIDYISKKGYYGWASKLVGKEKYLSSNNNLVFFDLDNFKDWRELTNEEVEKLKKYNQSNYD